MRKIIILFFVFIFSNLFSQENIDYSTIKNELELSSNTLYTKISIPLSEFYIEITKDSIINNSFYEPCVELKSDITKNDKILEILKNNDLLKEFYITKNDELIKISSDNNSVFGNQILNIELIFKSKNIKQPIILLIFEKNQAEKLLIEFYNLFENNECFLKMRKKLKT